MAAQGPTTIDTTGTAQPSPGNPVYGPVVHASSPINSSTSSRAVTTQASSDLDAALARLSGTPTQNNPNPDNTNNTTIDPSTLANDPIMKGLDTLSANSDAATKALIASTQAAYQNNVNSVTKQYGNYKAGLQQLGVETNEAQSTPELLAGHIQQAANDQLTKIQTLTANENKALVDANNAKATNDFKTLQSKMAYVKQVQTEKATAIKNMYDAVVNAGKQVTFDAPALYSAFKTLDPTDGEKYILAVSQKYGASPLSVQAALLSEQAKEVKAARVGTPKTGSGKITPEQINYGETKLNATRGPDGYVDAGVYLQAFKDWPGTTKEFIAAYPPKDYVNPDNTDLPKYLMPPKTKTSTTGGTQTP